MGMCSCDCSLSDGCYMHYGPSGPYPFNAGGHYRRRRRCASCGKLIDFGDECYEYEIIRGPRSEYEERRFGDEIHLAPRFHCEECGDIFATLWELAFRCMSPEVPVREYLQEYWDMTGFDPAKYADA